MYCSSCGMSVAQGLSYCNYCGAKLNERKGDNTGKSSEATPELVVSAMVALFVFGLLAIAVLIGVLKQIAGFDPPILLALIIFSMLLLFVVEGVLIRLLLKGRGSAKESEDSAPLKGQTTKELDATQARALSEAMPSVTENTTRAFEPIYTERKSK